MVLMGINQRSFLRKSFLHGLHSLPRTPLASRQRHGARDIRYYSSSESRRRAEDLACLRDGVKRMADQLQAFVAEVDLPLSMHALNGSQKLLRDELGLD